MLDVQRCGICGSDLHAKDHADELDDVMADVGYPDFMRSDTPVVMGHEFCGVVAERGRGVGQGVQGRARRWCPSRCCAPAAVCT